MFAESVNLRTFMISVAETICRFHVKYCWFAKQNEILHKKFWVVNQNSIVNYYKFDLEFKMLGLSIAVPHYRQ